MVLQISLVFILVATLSWKWVLIPSKVIPPKEYHLCRFDMFKVGLSIEYLFELFHQARTSPRTMTHAMFWIDRLQSSLNMDQNTFPFVHRNPQD